VVGHAGPAQEMASRGLAAVYDMADEATRKALLDSLMATLSGEPSRDWADMGVNGGKDWSNFHLHGVPEAFLLQFAQMRASPERGSAHPRLPGGASSLQERPRSGGPSSSARTANCSRRGSSVLPPAAAG
jgi:hypothetical protein